MVLSFPYKTDGRFKVPPGAPSDSVSHSFSKIFANHLTTYRAATKDPALPV